MGAGELQKQTDWHRTGNAFFPAAARVHDQWWILRLNSFPDHPLWTLFVDGERRFDLEDTPSPCGNPLEYSHTKLGEDEASRALGPINASVAYGREIGDSSVLL